MSAPRERESRLVRLPAGRGPILLEGPVEIVLPDGQAVRCDRPVVALCTCHRSQCYPLCDTSHRRHGRAAPAVTEEPAAEPPPRRTRGDT
ncbi:CDGSH iron-sulfur domain-containing protein [Kitasatospora sp. NBC_01250]|uniref:CDGSH iron-sulfur domain-containing protein n=1 Tax=Kitasatospora sp. NBC_01250 TaxID=2903571 RepID=UPI002E352675|nr:CDGSH iron-sulfur domain-containing protein [Kitasatospora sp. NBC_01250]